MQKLSRTENVARNIVWGYITNIVTLLLNFVSRTIFIYSLGNYYLGLNGLFSNVLGILSFTELGIGSVLNFSLYKPLANGDNEKTKSLMAVYKKAYRAIMLCVLIIGIAIIPLLPYMIKDAGDVEHIYLYYSFFLFNTVTSYLVSYKNGLMDAAQKGYTVNNIIAVVNVITVGVQCITLLVYKNYLLYLFIQAAFQLLQRVATSYYVDRQFPILKEKNVENLSKEEKKVLKDNVAAMVCHKIGDVCVNQTDNIIISSCISLSVVGKMSNYTLITSALNKIIMGIFNNCVASIGNFVAVESKERRKQIFKVYIFMAFWIYGVVAIELFVVLQPFVKIWVGEENTVDYFTIALVLLEFYLLGLRVAVANFKTACGIFQADKYIGIVQAVVNLVISIILAKWIGLPGIYIGTLSQGLIDVVWRPYLVYRIEFKESPMEYYRIWFKYLIIIVMLSVVSYVVFSKFLMQPSLIRIIIAGVVIFVGANLILYAIFRNKEEFQFLRNKVESIIRKVVHR